MKTQSRSRGFTLIELLIVMGILGILLAIVLIALNPQQQFQQANNTQRQSDVTAILDAVHQYGVDHRGTLPTGITTTAQTISSSTDPGNIDLCADLVPTYIADLPFDPTAGSETPTGSICADTGAEYDTGYTISVSTAGNRVTIAAPSAQLGVTISVTR